MGKIHTKPREAQGKPIPPKRQGSSEGDSKKSSSTQVSSPKQASFPKQASSTKQVSSRRRPGSPPVWGKILVDWYCRSHRKLPWRAEPGACHDPYRTWLSEIMLQQTTVVTVVPYYQKFLARWPTVYDLARADEADVLREWAGLGYYARGRNLLKGARTVVAEYNGVFPANIEALQKISGIGPYTASAVGAMALGLRTVPVDGNVERVMTRIYGIETPLPSAKPLIKQYAQSVLDGSLGVFSGDLAQAFMDLGATVCTPKSPKCGVCPLRAHCVAFAAGTVDRYPVMAPKVEKPTRRGDVFLISNEWGQYLTVRREAKGLLAGMPGFPTSHWDKNDILPPPYKNEVILGTVRHSFTHFNLILRVVHGTVKEGGASGAVDWYDGQHLNDVGLPKLFLKVAALLEKGSK